MLPDDKRHGQERGFFAHLAAGQEPCEACRIAHRRACKRREWNRANGKPATRDGIGTRRRIQALVALGWPMSRLDREAGRGNKWARNILYVNGDATYETTRRQVGELYERLHMRPPVAASKAEQSAITRARNMARQYGWPAPLDWDGLDIDDPEQHPGNAGGRRTTAAELLDDYEWLIESGEIPEVAAKRLGMSVRAFEQAANRMSKGADAA